MTNNIYLVKQEEDEAPTIMLLGNKADLVASGDQSRAVKTVDGESLARVGFSKCFHLLLDC